MPSLPVVENLQVLEEIRASFGARRPGALRDELDLQGREEAFGHGVVPAVTAAAHAARDPVRCEAALVLRARILTPAIRMVEQAAGGLAARESHGERVDSELAGYPRARRPADHAPREQVEDDDQVEPALERPQIRDVADPDRVRGCRRELPIEDIGGDGPRVLRIRRHAEPPLGAGAQALRLHQPGDALAPDALTAIAQLRVHSRTAVPAPTLRMNRCDLHRQPLIALRPRGRRPLLPGIAARPGDPEHLAQRGYGEAGLLRRDEAELHSLSLAKKAVAFFRMSRSIRRRLFSRRSCASSSRSLVVSAPAGPRPASISACRTHRRSAVSVRSSSRAIAPILFPLSRTNRTVSALNSSENARRLRFSPIGHSYRTFVRFEVSTKPGEGQSYQARAQGGADHDHGCTGQGGDRVNICAQYGGASVGSTSRVMPPPIVLGMPPWRTISLARGR